MVFVKLRYGKAADVVAHLGTRLDRLLHEPLKTRRRHVVQADSGFVQRRGHGIQNLLRFFEAISRKNSRLFLTIKYAKIGDELTFARRGVSRSRQ